MADMKVVYALKDELARDPERLRRTHALSLNKEKPLMGLAATHGLFGSPEWWRDVDKGLIRREQYRGVITRLFVAGMDYGDEPNSFEIESNDGVKFIWNMLSLEEGDASLYQVGRWAEIETVFTELKRRREDGSPEFVERPLRISLSVD
ncbi:MAG: hypothetical protein ABL883_10190 [Terricaulis sp.]